MAFYEMYGHNGIKAFEDTVRYAKEKGLVVIEDGKRNDIGNTAKAYADGHLGMVDLGNGARIPSLDVDFLTVSPFLGSDSLAPFIDVCKEHNKGLFILVKTSNPGSGEIQDVAASGGLSISRIIAKYVAENAEEMIGAQGYSPIGAVVGATYPEEAMVLRRDMPNSILLVPGYGAQGADARDIVHCFNPDGYGAIVNASRSVLYAYEQKSARETCTREMYQQSVTAAVATMRQDICAALADHCGNLDY